MLVSIKFAIPHDPSHGRELAMGKAMLTQAKIWAKNSPGQAAQHSSSSFINNLCEIILSEYLTPKCHDIFHVIK